MATAAKRSWAWSMPRTSPVRADPTVEPTTRSGNQRSSRWKSGSRASQARRPINGARLRIATEIAGSERCTWWSLPVMVTVRAAQCCRGNARAAAAKLQ